MGRFDLLSGWRLFRKPTSPRRRALALGYLNGMLWSIGNGLTTGALVIYLARDLGARGAGIGLILAAPALVGVLRLGTPAVISLFGSAKRACLALSVVSYALIWVLPAAAFDDAIPRSIALATLIVLLCLHQLLESVALAALWGWLAEVVPRPIRGRYFAGRQVLQIGVLIPTLLASGYFADRWRGQSQPAASAAQNIASPSKQNQLLGYAIPNAIGAAALMASLVPLLMMPATLGRRRALTNGAGRAQPSPVARTLAPWRDRRYWPMLVFGCWLSFSNGLTQSAQNIYYKDSLALSVFGLAVMKIGMQFGQMGYSAWVGRFSDRFGNRPVLIVSQLVLAAAPLFLLAASAERPWIAAGAWLCWSAYAGLNICLPNLALKLGGNAHAAAYVATYFGVTSLFYAGSSIGAGWLFDQLEDPFYRDFAQTWGGRFALFFWTAFVMRATAVLWLIAIPEPGARRWRDILTKRTNAETTAETISATMDRSVRRVPEA